MMLRRLLEPKLAALVAVKQQPGVLVRVALESGHTQRVNNDVRRHVLAQRPTHHLATEQVDDHGQVKPALISGDVISPTQALLGSATVNSRLSRLGEIGNL